jgi:hypothetical protein
MKISVYSSHGTLHVDNDTGYITLDKYTPEAPEGLEHIRRFDLEEFRLFWGYTKETTPTSIDILDLGYWHDEGYEEADMDWRKDFAQAIKNGEIQGVTLSVKASNLLFNN